eukprot:1558281-Rhodomonas_salina.3
MRVCVNECGPTSPTSWLRMYQRTTRRINKAPRRSESAGAGCYFSPSHYHARHERVRAQPGLLLCSPKAVPLHFAGHFPDLMHSGGKLFAISGDGGMHDAGSESSVWVTAIDRVGG